MQPLILHIPHASTVIPFRDGFVIDDVQLQQEIDKLTDWYTDDLFFTKSDVRVVAPFSRVFCDVERFDDDGNEPMAKVGMGVLYSLTDNLEPMRMVNSVLRRKILIDYYQKHHAELSAKVNSHLNMYGQALVVDCHSFANEPFERDLNKTPNRPDICIGSDDFHTPKALVDFSYAFFENEKLTIAINSPYSGALVPMAHYQREKNVNAIMIELNRKLYLTNDCKKSENFVALQRVVSSYLEALKLFWCQNV